MLQIGNWICGAKKAVARRVYNENYWFPFRCSSVLLWTNFNPFKNPSRAQLSSGVFWCAADFSLRLLLWTRPLQNEGTLSLSDVLDGWKGGGGLVEELPIQKYGEKIDRNINEDRKKREMKKKAPGIVIWRWALTTLFLLFWRTAMNCRLITSGVIYPADTHTQWGEEPVNGEARYRAAVYIKGDFIDLVQWAFLSLCKRICADSSWPVQRRSNTRRHKYHSIVRQVNTRPQETVSHIHHCIETAHNIPRAIISRSSGDVHHGRSCRTIER